VNLEEKYKLLKNLYKENLKEDAKLKWKKVKEEYNIKQSSLQSEAEELSRQYKEAQKITDEVKRAKEIAKIQAEAKKVLTEWKEQEEFIAQVQQLSGGKMDVTSNWPEKEKQK
jgi:ATPase subunit of ABC transporter with duplicated ATPase domains